MMERAPQPVREMLALLRESGHTPYLVGGCVRDLLRGAEPDDYDMTSDARPEEVMALFGADAHPTGLMHGTVTLVRGGFAVEHTTERCDGAYRDSRHPESVRFTSSIEEDLARRDFTVNAIALSADGRLVDPFGGREDLARGVIRCVGEPDRRFGEDALRVMRALRFAACFGFSIGEETARGLRRSAPGLRRIAAERLREEMTKLLCGDGAAAVLLAYPEVIGVFLPEILPSVGFEQHNPHHCHTVWEHLVRSAAAVNTPRSAYSPKCAHLRRMWSVIHGRSRCTTVSSAPLSAPLCVAGIHDCPQMTSSHAPAQTVRMRLARRFMLFPLPSARGSCPPSTCGTWRRSCRCRRAGSARPR